MLDVGSRVVKDIAAEKVTGASGAVPGGAGRNHSAQVGSLFGLAGSLPPCGGGLGWGEKAASCPPTPTLPRNGGREKNRTALLVCRSGSLGVYNLRAGCYDAAPPGRDAARPRSPECVK